MSIYVTMFVYILLFIITKHWKQLFLVWQTARKVNCLCGWQVSALFDVHLTQTCMCACVFCRCAYILFIKPFLGMFCNVLNILVISIFTDPYFRILFFCQSPFKYHFLCNYNCEICESYICCKKCSAYLIMLIQKYVDICCNSSSYTHNINECHIWIEEMFKETM